MRQKLNGCVRFNNYGLSELEVQVLKALGVDLMTDTTGVHPGQGTPANWGNGPLHLPRP